MTAKGKPACTRLGPAVRVLAAALTLLLPACLFTSPVKDIDAPTLKRMMDEDPKTVVVDTRTPREFAEGHIPGARHIPEDRFSGLADLLPGDKDTPIVFYCRGFG